MSRVYYGWWIVAGCMINMIITSGICNIAFPVFLVPWTDHFGWSRTAAAGGISMLLLALGISAPVAGRLAMRYGPRQIMLPATALAGFCLWSCAWMTTLWQLYVIRLLAGVAFAGMAHVPVNILMSRWFNNLRGRATGLALIGAPIGGLLFTPIVSVLVQNFGWRSALMLLGSLVWLVLLPLQFLVLKDDPQSSLTSDTKLANEQPVASGLSIEEIMRIPRFWILLLVLFFYFTGIFSMMVHQLPHFIDNGRSPNEAAFLVSIMMGCSVLGGASFGWVSDRYNVYRLFAMCAALMIAGVIALLANLPYLYLAMFGLGFGIFICHRRGILRRPSFIFGSATNESMNDTQ